MSRIKGKLVVITGASSGIGEACAEIFAASGCDLYLLARRVDKLVKLSQQLTDKYGVKVHYKELDVRNRMDVEFWGEELRKNDLTPYILINNAGLAAGRDYFYEASVDDWEAMIDTNLKGLLYITKAVIPYMLHLNSGHIINVGSIAGEEPYEKGGVYNATKFGVKALTRSMNLDLINTRIKVSTIAPGLVNTEFSTVRYKGDSLQAEKVYEGMTPLSASDVADAIHYVCSAPEHVNIEHLIILPTAQRSINCVSRE